VFTVAYWLYQKRAIIGYVLLAIALLFGAYKAWAYFHPPNPVTFESQQQASTPAGVMQAANNAQVPLTASQAFDVSEYIRDNQNTYPTSTETTTGSKLQQVVSNAVYKFGGDFAIVTDPKNPTQKPVVKPGDTVVLNEYVTKAYPDHLLTAGGGKGRYLVGWSVRVNVPKIPLLAPRGDVGYVGFTGVHMNNINGYFVTITVPK